MSIGSQLRQRREAQSLSLDQVAQATHIKLHYLEALEADEFDRLPSAAQLRGFLRAYGDYLKLNTDDLVQALDTGTAAPSIPASSPTSQEKIHTTPANSETIFKELGHTLQSQRELMGLSLGDVERHTHIRIHYVRALEEGDISHLPSPVQGRGMLSNYATFLGLNTETILLRFADGLQAGLYDRQASRNPSTAQARTKIGGQIPSRPSQFKRFFSMDLFVAGFLIIFLLGFTIWGALRISRLHEGQVASPTAPPVSEILLSTATAELTGASTPIASAAITSVPATFIETEPVSGTAQVNQTPGAVVFESTPGLDNAPLQVYVVALQYSWMRIIVDGEVAFEGRVLPGSAYSFAGNERVELLTGDGAGLQAYFNQQDLGVLGGLGEVVNLVFSIEGVQTATPAVPFTSTPVPTKPVTPSPTPTRTTAPATPTPTSRP